MTEQYLHIERLRGWIINFIYLRRPAPLELAYILDLLARRLMPISRRRLAEELDFLASPSLDREKESRLIRVFPSNAEHKLTDVEQAKVIQAYASSKNEAELEEMLQRLGFTGPVFASITAVGQNFHEGRREWEGIERVF